MCYPIFQTWDLFNLRETKLLWLKNIFSSNNTIKQLLINLTLGADCKMVIIMSTKAIIFFSLLYIWKLFFYVISESY